MMLSVAYFAKEFARMGLIRKLFGERKAHSNQRRESSTEKLIVSPFHRTPPRTGTRDLLEAYSNMPWLRAVAGKIATAVSVTQWRLYVIREAAGDQRRIITPRSIQKCPNKALRERKIRSLIKRNGSPTVFNLEEITEHPILDLLEHGNEWMTGRDVFKVTQLHYDLAGEAFWLIERNGLGLPVAIWPLPPHWISEFPRPDSPYYKVQFEYNYAEIPVTEIIRICDPDPMNPYGRGTGLARALGDELETDEYAAKHVKTFFYNRARPDLIISADDLTKEDTRRLEEGWLAKMRGFWNAYKPYFINKKIDVKEIGQTFENMQLTQLRKHERDTIIQVFGAPPEKLGVLSQSNRSTIAAADLFWTKDLIMPRVENLRTVIQSRLVPLFDERLILDYDSPVVEDSEHELRVMSAMPGAFTKNEWRAMANKDSLGEIGDVFLLQPGQVQLPMDQAGFAGQLQSVDQAPSPDQAEDQSDQQQGQGDQKSMMLSQEVKEQILLHIKQRLVKRIREKKMVKT